MQCFFSRESFKVFEYSLYSSLLAKGVVVAMMAEAVMVGGGSSFSLIAGLSNYKRGHHLQWIDTNRWIWGSLPMVNSIVILQGGFTQQLAPTTEKRSSLSPGNSDGGMEVQNGPSLSKVCTHFLSLSTQGRKEKSDTNRWISHHSTERRGATLLILFRSLHIFLQCFSLYPPGFVCQSALLFCCCQVWKFFDFLSIVKQRRRGESQLKCYLYIDPPAAQTQDCQGWSGFPAIANGQLIIFNGMLLSLS